MADVFCDRIVPMRASMTLGTFPHVWAELLEARDGLRRIGLCGRCAFERSSYTSIASDGVGRLKLGNGDSTANVECSLSFLALCGESYGNALATEDTMTSEPELERSRFRFERSDICRLTFRWRVYRDIRKSSWGILQVRIHDCLSFSFFFSVACDFGQHGVTPREV